MTSVDRARADSATTLSTLEVIVTDKTAIASEIVLLTLESFAGEPLPAWAPGSHIDLHLGDRLVRQYSLCGSPNDTHRYQVAVLLDPHGQGGSQYIHGELTPGQRLTVSTPRNNFPLASGDEYLFFAGGVGITPILPMIDHLDHHALNWNLVYGGRTRESMAFLDALAKYENCVTLVPQDQYGLIDIDGALDDFLDPSKNQRIYCCGPEALLSAVEQSVSRRPGAVLHTERFTAKEIDTSSDLPLEVHLATSGLTLQVPADQSILDAVTSAGIFLTSSCREGICGTCEVGVLDGTPEHRDSVLTDEEKSVGDCMMICVSRAQGQSLTIDL